MKMILQNIRDRRGLKVYLIALSFVVGTLCSEVLAASGKAHADTTFFNGENLTGWSSTDMSFWSVQNGAIVGHSDQYIKENKFLWSEVKVKDFYLSIEVLLKPENRNAGIQFRSQKVDKSGQAIGYQADIGRGIWGKLYHEHGRGPLDGTSRGSRVVKHEEWNHYEILAVGDRIWTAINGVLSVAVEDPGGDLSGYIALQIHSGKPQTVKYRINKLVHNPKVELAGLNVTQLEKELKAPIVPPRGKPLLDFTHEGEVRFIGGTNITNMQKYGFLERLITSGYSTRKLYFQNINGAGETVYNYYSNVDFVNQVKIQDSTVGDIVFVQFGQMESLKGEKGLPRFIDFYKRLLDEFKGSETRIVLISPIPFEPSLVDSSGQQQLHNLLANAPVEKYANAIKKLAQSEGYVYVDLFHQLEVFGSVGLRVTSDGINLTPEGHRFVAPLIMKGLGFPGEFIN